MEHKSGFVNILGNPNVGKSTLSNAIIGERLSIISPKAQTTRHRIMGIVNTDDYQLVFSDTPGILKPHYKLHESMMKFVDTAFTDADIIIFVTDIYEKGIEDDVLYKLNNAKVPVLVLLNKVDQGDEERIKESLKFWSGFFTTAEIIPISALHNFNLDKVLNRIVELLPIAPPYFDKTQLTDKPTRFFIAEIIREKIFFNYKKEVPYSCEVVIETFEEEPTITRIRAIIVVARDSQKGIIIGQQGLALKKVGTQARIEMEKFLDTKVFLELYVKTNKDWRDDDNQLKRFGYVD